MPGRAAVEQLHALGGRVGDAERRDRRVVVAAALELGEQSAGGMRGAAQLGHALDARDGCGSA